MGLIELILSVVVDAVWPLRGRTQDLPFDAQAGGVVAADEAVDPEAADPLADPPYDPLIDPAVDAALDPSAMRDDPARDPLADAVPDPLTAGRAGSSPAPAPVAAAAGYTAHPLLRHALRLIDWVASDRGPAPQPGLPVSPASTASPVGPRHLSVGGWLVVVGVPAVLVAVAEALLGAVAGLFVFILHVAVLYLTVGLGAFHRQFSELQLLVGAGEDASARVVLARWIGAGGPPTARSQRATTVPADGLGTGTTAPTLAASAAGHAILAGYREVFAPLFWYVVLPGAIGPVIYLFARFAACHSQPFARSAYYWIDWIPLRLASFVFAVVGRFEDTMYSLRAVGRIRVADDADPYLHQRLLLLPVAGGALGLRLADAGVDAHLRTHAPDLDLPGAEPEGSSLRSVSNLLLRSGVVAACTWLLVILLD